MLETNEEDLWSRAENEFEIDDSLVVAYALHLRGKKSAAKRVLDILERKHGSGLSDAERRDVVQLRELPAGIPPQVYHCSRLGIALQAQAMREASEGNIDAALTTYLQSAMAGNPNALGSYTWQHLLMGNCQAAIDGYEKARSKCIEPYRKGVVKLGSFHEAVQLSEMANCDSNYALAQLGVGANLGVAIALWEPNLETGHTETRFFLAMAQHKVGEFEGRDATLRGMSDEQWSAMKDEMKDMSRNASGFFKTWCAEGADFLKQFKR
jgi:hypothetical protein